MLPKRNSGALWLQRSNRLFLVCFLCILQSVSSRYVTPSNFGYKVDKPSSEDLVAAAAEPRPVFVEPEPSGQALPLVYEVGTPVSDGIGVASEQISKILRPAASFSYNINNNDQVAATSNTSEKEEESEEEDVEEEIEESHEDLDKNQGEGSEINKDVTAESVDVRKTASAHHDTETQASGHDGKGEDGKQKDAHYVKGGGKEFNADHGSQHGEKGDKGYDGFHKHEKGEKGYHIKEGHKKEFEDDGGTEKKHHHSDGYFGEHESEEKGQKGAKYGEGGEHSKGHSTKGSHSIHKKDEYEKKTEFFDEDEDGAEFEKHGGYSSESDYSKGGHEKGSHKKGADHHDHYGKESDSKKGYFFHDEKGHKDAKGHEQHHAHTEKHGHVGDDSEGKMWGYKHSKGTGGGGGGGHGSGGKGGGGGNSGHHGAHSHINYKVHETAEPKKHENLQEPSETANENAHEPIYVEEQPATEIKDNGPEYLPYVTLDVVPEEALPVLQHGGTNPDNSYRPSSKELVESQAQRRNDYDDNEEPTDELAESDKDKENTQAVENSEVDDVQLDEEGTDEIGTYVPVKVRHYSPQMPKLIEAVHEVHKNTPSSKEQTQQQRYEQEYENNAEGSHQSFIIVAAE